MPLPDRYAIASEDELAKMISKAKTVLGKRLVILGHHYQRDEIICWADARGDSLGLARFAANQRLAQFIVFCGVMFMAETADILTGIHQQVLLPDLNAGCPMADMADLDSVQTAWDEISEVIDINQVVPITYINSSAALKAFTGNHNGTVCTSSNAVSVLRQALKIRSGATDETDLVSAARQQGRKVLFFPDQHLGRNTAYDLGFAAGDMCVWDPNKDRGGLTDMDFEKATFFLWKGYCSVHQRIRPEYVTAFRFAHPDGKVIVHSECAHEVVALADMHGSTNTIIRYVEASAPGTTIGIGTEIHLVHRLANEHPELAIVSLDPLVCPCSTMNRIDPPHLAWVLEGLVDGEARNRIMVDSMTAGYARIALDRMLTIT
jgi:quinolinate synthase